MQSKFWAAGSESSDVDVSSSEGEEGQEPEVAQPKRPAAQASRWAVAETSSSENERRVVKSLKDRVWSSMREIVRQMQNHMKIGDFAELQKDYDQLIKSFNKASQVVEQHGIPNFFIRHMVDLDSFLEAKHKDKESFKKLSKVRALALNTLRAKVRKSNEAWSEKVEECRENPEAFETESDDSDGFDSDSDFSDEDDTSESSSEGSSDEEVSPSPPTKTAGEGSDEGSEWYDSEAEDESSGDDVDRHKVAMAKWGIREEGEKKKAKSSSTKKKTSSKHSKAPKEAAATESMFSVKDMEHLFDATDLTPEIMVKRVRVVVEKRGRRGVDRAEQIKILRRLAEIATTVGPNCHLEVMCHLISAQFDTTSGVFTCLSLPMWLETFAGMRLMLDVLEENPELCHSAVVADDDDEIVVRGVSVVILTSFIERLDDELTKSLQFTDVHSDDYKERLGRTMDMLALLWRVYVFLDSHEYKQSAATIALKINEHMHYKHDTIAIRMWDAVRKQLDDSVGVLLPDETNLPSAFVEKLTRVVFKFSESSREKTRALLHVAYNKSLHGMFYEARDLLHTPNIQELAMQTDISTQILYNRNLVQLGLCAFRNGLIMDAHSCLSQVFPKHKELLAQGLSNLKNTERTPEQERAEKRRLLPYHMHISMELIEGAHNICAMLLEVPLMAQDVFETRKRLISKHFRRVLETYDSQAFSGPPENARETVMAATKALQRGDWGECCRLIFSLNIWEKMLDKDHIQEMLTKRIKEEAMRTYIFTYLSLYDSFSVAQLCSMFDLSKNSVHSIVSKMMINEEIHASWDETSNYVLISRVEHTRLQQLAISLSENVTNAIEQNELTLNMKNPKFALTHERRFQMREGGDRYGWGNREREEHSGYRGRSGYYGRGGFNPAGTRGRGRGRGRGVGGPGMGGRRRDRQYNPNDQRDGFRIKFTSGIGYK